MALTFILFGIVCWDICETVVNLNCSLSTILFCFASFLLAVGSPVGSMHGINATPCKCCDIPRVKVTYLLELPLQCIYQCFVVTHGGFSWGLG